MDVKKSRNCLSSNVHYYCKIIHMAKNLFKFDVKL